MKKTKWMRFLPVVALLALLLCLPVQAAGAPRAVLNAKDGVVRIFCRVGDDVYSGSGFLIANSDSGALVVTNYHVVEGASRIVLLYDGNGPVELNVVAIAEDRDLCLLRAPNALPGMTPLALASTVQIGEAVYALGYPGGSDVFSDDLALTKDEMALTGGLVSALPRSHQVGDLSHEVQLVQISADINPGNSGGPLLNEGGKVIGVNTMGVNDDAIAGINAAVHVTELRAFLRENKIQYLTTTDSDFTWSVLGVLAVVSALLGLAIWVAIRDEKRKAPPASQPPLVTEAPAEAGVPQSPRVPAPTAEPPAGPPQLFATVALPGMELPGQAASTGGPTPAPAMAEPNASEQLEGQLGLFEAATAPQPETAVAAAVASAATSAPVPPAMGQELPPPAPPLPADATLGPPQGPPVPQQAAPPAEDLLVAPMPPTLGADAPAATADGFAPGYVQAPGFTAPLPTPLPYDVQGQTVAAPAAKKPLSRGKKGLLVAAASVGLLLLIVLFSGIFITQKLNTALAEKNYVAVLDIYQENPWATLWADKRQKPYCEGMLLLKQGKYAAGLKKLQGLNGYADSDNAEIYVRAINRASPRRQYLEFSSLGDYLDSAQRAAHAAEKCYYEAESYLQQGDFTNAEVYLENVLGTYKNAAKYKKLIQQAKHIDSPPECYAFSQSCYDMGFNLPPEIGQDKLQYFMEGDWIAQNGWEYFSLHDNQWDTNMKFKSSLGSFYIHDFGFFNEEEGGTPLVEVEIVNYKEIILHYWGYTRYLYRT